MTCPASGQAFEVSISRKRTRHSLPRNEPSQTGSLVLDIVVVTTHSAGPIESNQCETFCSTQGAVQTHKDAAKTQSNTNQSVLPHLLPRSKKTSIQ